MLNHSDIRKLQGEKIPAEAKQSGLKAKQAAGGVAEDPIRPHAHLSATCEDPPLLGRHRRPERLSLFRGHLLNGRAR